MAAIGTAATTALAALATMPANTRREVRALALAALRALGAEELVATLSIQWNGRFTRRMGDANPTLNRVRFSTPLWPRATEDQRRETVVHEVCHLVDELRNGRTEDHGPTWKAIMLEAGYAPERCHRVDRTGLVRTVKAHCQCQEYDLGKGRAAALRTGRRIYTCRKCGAKLALGPKPRTEEEEIARLLELDREARREALEAEARKLRAAAQDAPREPQAPAVDVTINRAGQAGWRW